jgi:hypothetical protein
MLAVIAVVRWVVRQDACPVSAQPRSRWAPLTTGPSAPADPLIIVDDENPLAHRILLWSAIFAFEMRTSEV